MLGLVQELDSWNKEVCTQQNVMSDIGTRKMADGKPFLPCSSQPFPIDSLAMVLIYGWCDEANLETEDFR
jgi:hypothetical protein